MRFQQNDFSVCSNIIWWKCKTYLGVKFVQNVLQVVALDGLLRIEQIEELLHELGSHVDFKRANLDRLVDHKLQEELVDALEMRPCGVHFLFLVDTSLGEVQIAFFDVRKGTEDVLLNHLHDFVEVGDNHTHNVFLVLEHLLELGDGVKAFGLRVMGTLGQTLSF